MGTRNRAVGQDAFSQGDHVVYAPNGDLERIQHRWDTTRAIVGVVESDVASVVTYADRLPEPVLRRVATGGTATAGRPAIAGGHDGLTNAPTLGSGSTGHWVEGVWAGEGIGGEDVLMHPVPHWCAGGDVE